MLSLVSVCACLFAYLPSILVCHLLSHCPVTPSPGSTYTRPCKTPWYKDQHKMGFWSVERLKRYYYNVISVYTRAGGKVRNTTRMLISKKSPYAAASHYHAEKVYRCRGGLYHQSIPRSPSIWKMCEEHSAVLRRDVEEYIKAHQEYTANSPPMGFMPPRDEFDHYIEVSEKVLKTECRTLLEQVAYKYEVIVLIYYLFVATFMWYALGSFLPGSWWEWCLNTENAWIWNSFVEKWRSSTCLSLGLACILINAFLSNKIFFPSLPLRLFTPHLNLPHLIIPPLFLLVHSNSRSHEAALCFSPGDGDSFIWIRAIWLSHPPSCSCIRVHRSHEAALCLKPGDGAYRISTSSGGAS